MKKNVSSQEAVKRVILSLVMILIIKMCNLNVDYITPPLIIWAAYIFASGVVQFSFFYYIVDIIIDKKRK